MTMSEMDDDRPQNEDDLDEDDEEEEEEEEVAEAAPAQPAPNPVPPGSTGVGKPVDKHGQQRKRKKKKRGEQTPRETKPQDPNKPREADLLWEWVIDRCEEQDIYPHNVNIRVARVDIGREVTAGTLQGDRVLGDDHQTPSEALYEAIVESFHIPGNLRGPILYNVIFSIRGDKGFSHRGQLNLPPVEEILRRRQNGWYPGGASPPHGHPGYVPPPPRYSRSDRDREGPRGYGRRDRDDRDRDYDDRYDDRRDSRRGVGAPPATHSQPYPPQYGPPPGYYDDRYDRDRGRRRGLEREIDDLKDLVREFIRGGGQQSQQPQGPDLAALHAHIQTLEKTFGVKFTVAGLGGIPQPQQLPQQARDPESQEFEQVIARKVRVGVGKRVDAMLEEILDPDAAEKRRAKRQAEEEEEDDEDKPESDIDVVELPVTYPGTDVPLRYAKSRDTNEFSLWPSLGLNLPVVMDRHGDKLIDLMTTFAKGGLAGLGRQPPQPPQQMPPRQNVNGSGVGHQPPPRQEPSAPPPRDDDDDFRL